MENIKIFVSESVDSTYKIAQDFAQTLKNGDIVAFEGGLGAGKTHFTKGIAKGLGIEDSVTSPTFTLINHYQTENETSSIKNLYHFDMYRINGYDDFASTGFHDYLEENGIIIIEWSENIKNYLPRNIIKIELEIINENTRGIKIRR